MFQHSQSSGCAEWKWSCLNFYQNIFSCCHWSSATTYKISSHKIKRLLSRWSFVQTDEWRTSRHVYYVPIERAQFKCGRVEKRRILRRMSFLFFSRVRGFWLVESLTGRIRRTVMRLLCGVSRTWISVYFCFPAAERGLKTCNLLIF